VKFSIVLTLEWGGGELPASHSSCFSPGPSGNGNGVIQPTASHFTDSALLIVMFLIKLTQPKDGNDCYKLHNSQNSELKPNKNSVNQTNLQIHMPNQSSHVYCSNSERIKLSVVLRSLFPLAGIVFAI